MIAVHPDAGIPVSSLLAWSRALVFAYALCPLSSVRSEHPVSENTPYEIHTLPGESGRGRSFLVMPPETTQAGQRYPLVLFLHGAGERGNDLRKTVVHLPAHMTTAEYRRRFPCFFVVPQCPDNQMWIGQPWSEKSSVPMPELPTPAMQVAIEILDTMLKSPQVDSQRVYLTGLSMGGFGTWELAMREPDRFAAILPVCGGGDERQVARIAHLPVWTAHGDADPVVSVERTRTMVTALQKIQAPVQYSEYAGEGHASWNRAYSLQEGLLDWLFQQRRTSAKQR